MATVIANQIIIPHLNLREILQKRILHECLVPVEGWKVVVTDSASLKVLSAACKMNDILDRDVTLIEDIAKSRQPYPGLDAVYFLSPSEATIRAFIKDFEGKSPMYARAHLFFIAAVPDPLFKMIGSSSAYKFVRTFKELYVDFVAFESLVFSFDRPSSFFYLFSPDQSNEYLRELDSIAAKLVSAVTTIGDIPLIRYASNSSSPNRRTIELAKQTQIHLDRYVAASEERTERSGAQPILLILDRTVDYVAPLLHEFTYQAMANDILNIENGNKYHHKYTSTVEGRVNKDVLLDETDLVWAQTRHTHIAETIETIISDFNKFVNENKAAIKSTSKSKTETSGGVNSLTEMKETLNALPQFQELKGKFSVHMAMAQECMAEFEARNLSKTAGLEQDMATGFTADGNEVKNAVFDLVPLLNDPNVSNYDKLRLLMIYFITREGVTDADRHKLLQHANVTVDESNAITNLSLLGVRLTKDAKKKAVKKEKQKKKRADDVPYELSRFVPAIKSIIDDCANGTLDSANFPYTREPVADPAARRAPVTSLRTGKADWQKGGAKAAVERPNNSAARIIVFIAGGMTYSEMRTAYELTSSLKRDVVIGSTHIWTPKLFVDALRDLKKPEVIDLNLSSARPVSGTGTPPKSKSLRDRYFRRA